MTAADRQGYARLADRAAIEALLVRYCVFLDRMELESLAALFTDDCRVEYGADTRLQARGRTALADSLTRMWRWVRTSHHLSNVLIEFADEATAAVESYVQAWHERPDGSTATVFGCYRDTVVSRNGRWLIHRRRMFENGSDAGFSVPLYRTDRRSPPPGWSAPPIDEAD